MRKFFVLALAAMLALTMAPGAAQAKGKPHTKKAPQVPYSFKGTIASVDATANTVVVDVEGANEAARSFVGQRVGFSVKPAPGKGATRIELDDARAALSELEAGDLVVVQAKAPRGATPSTTGGFAALVIDAKTPPAPYYSDADGDGIGFGEAEWYVPGNEPSGWVSASGPDNCPGVANPDQADADGDGMGDACEEPVVTEPVTTDPVLTGASV